MQPQRGFASSAYHPFGHTLLGTLLGTLGGFFARSIQKTKGKRNNATVFLTVAFSKKRRRAFTTVTGLFTNKNAVDLANATARNSSMPKRVNERGSLRVRRHRLECRLYLSILGGLRFQTS